MYGIGYAHAPRFGESLQARGNIHSITEHVVLVEYHVSKINPDAIFNAAVHRTRAFALHHCGLDVDGALHGVLNGGKFHQYSVACSLYNMPAMSRDSRIYQLPTVRLVTREYALLILLHEPAVTRHIGDKDGS
jgi:hypothetical protein